MYTDNVTHDAYGPGSKLLLHGTTYYSVPHQRGVGESRCRAEHDGEECAFARAPLVKYCSTAPCANVVWVPVERFAVWRLTK